MGAVVLLLAGGGISFMTSPYPLVAGGFFSVAAVLFLAKFVTWEEARAQTSSRGKVIVIGTVITAFILILAIGGNHLLHRPVVTSIKPALAATPSSASPPTSKPAIPEMDNRPYRKKLTASTMATNPSKTGLDISAYISQPTDPAITVENKSDNVADGIVWELAMFRASDQAFFSYVTQNIGYVKAHDKSAPHAMELTTLPRAGCQPNGERR